MAKDDINFDELDKAVSSVLRQQTKPEVPNDSTTTTSEAKEDDKLPEVPQVETSDEVSANDTSENVRKVDTPVVVEERPAVVAPRRRGQFMDVIRPDDSKSTESTVNYSARRPSTLQPLNPDVVKDTTEKKDDNQPASEDPQEVIETSYVDPISEEETFGQSVEESGPEETVDVPEVSEIENNFASTNESIPTTKEEDKDLAVEETVGTAEPATSPFLSGTEVEKRPLGAYADSGNDDIKEEGKSVNSDDSTLPETEPAVTVQPESLPAELSSEVVSVESDNTSIVDMEKGDIAARNAALGSQSITPQYQAEPVEDEGETHPVFDTKQYHQPLTPAAKPRAGSKALKYILLVIFMLALGAAGGYLVWVLKLI